MKVSERVLENHNASCWQPLKNMQKVFFFQRDCRENLTN